MVSIAQCWKMLAQSTQAILGWHDVDVVNEMAVTSGRHAAQIVYSIHKQAADQPSSLCSAHLAAKDD